MMNKFVLLIFVFVLAISCEKNEQEVPCFRLTKEVYQLGEKIRPVPCFVEGGIDYFWTLTGAGGVQTSTNQTPSFKVPVSGDYTLSLSYHEDGKNSRSESFSVEQKTVTRFQINAFPATNADGNNWDENSAADLQIRFGPANHPLISDCDQCFRTEVLQDITNADLPLNLSIVTGPQAFNADDWVFIVEEVDDNNKLEIIERWRINPGSRNDNPVRLIKGETQIEYFWE